MAVRFSNVGYSNTWKEKVVTRETKVGLVIGLLFIVGVVYLLHWATTPTDNERQASYGRSDVSYQPPQDDRLVPLERHTDSLANSLKSDANQAIKPDAIGPVQTKTDLGQAAPPQDLLPEPAKPQPRFYVVKPGQNLTDIARDVYGPQHGEEWHRILEANKYKVQNERLIRPDMKLIIPPLEGTESMVARPPLSLSQESTYTVRPGDTLSDISAKKLGSSQRWRQILDLNRDKLTDEHSLLRPGMILKLPPLSKG